LEKRENRWSEGFGVPEYNSVGSERVTEGNRDSDDDGDGSRELRASNDGGGGIIVLLLSTEAAFGYASISVILYGKLIKPSFSTQKYDPGPGPARPK